MAKKVQKNIVLIGMPGAYKTTVGKLLAPKISYMSLDTDEYVEFQMAISVGEIIKKYGEEAFRGLESNCIQTVVSYKKAVISTGGGAVLDVKNVRAFKNCFVIYLYATPKTIFKRIGKNTTRPLITPNTLEKVEEIYSQRKSLYENCADIIINTNNLTSETVTQKIIEKLTENKVI